MGQFSQSDEDLFILQKFQDKPTGKFVDVGAFHIERFSNTRALYLKGWRGVLVEPSPANYKAIADHYTEDKEMTVLNVAIGETNEEIEFYDCGSDAISTSDISHRDKWAAAGVQYTKIKVQQMAVLDFCEKYCRNADFLSVDTESTNMTIFRLIPDWVWEQITCLCIEHDTCTDEIEEKLKQFGFVTLYVNAENILLAKNN